MLMAPDFQTLPDHRGRRLMRGWAALAIAALAGAGLFAILLVLSRTPVLEDALPWPEAFFTKGLVVHVALSFAVWFLAVLAVFAQWAAASAPKGDPAPWLGEAGLGVAVAGTVLMIIPAFAGTGEPTLNNYIPVIIHPLFYAGLVIFALGVAIAVVRLLAAFARTPNLLGTATLVLLTAGILYIAALVAFALAAHALQGVPASFDYNERLIWGGGHLLQFVNIALLTAAWGFLAETSATGPLVGPSINRWTTILIFIGGIVGLAFFALFDVHGTTFLQAFTELQYALGPPVVLFALTMIGAAWRRRASFDWRSVAGASLITSVILFGVGGIFGFFVDGADTRTPAHYHGVIGGINLAFVGLFYTRFLPLAGCIMGSVRVARWQIYIYGIGQLLFCAGMYAAGGMGAARKVVGSGVDMENMSAIVAATVRDIGGGLAVIGGVMFIVIAIRALLRPKNRSEKTA